jgi:2-polyprenyl-3-methyl-5-hydroxy-6-metoxy-1,4-benzoquinol methylase
MSWKKVVERFDPHDTTLLEQTKRHHLKRYEFASAFLGKSYLDICCGQGYGTNYLKQEHEKAFVLGIDKEPSIILAAQKEYPNCQFGIMDIRRLALSRKFDVITFFEAIEHLTFTEGTRVLEYIHKELIEPYGVLIISTPRDIQDRYNIYHKSMWSYETLKNILGSLFNNVRMYGQSWETGLISEENVIENDYYLCVCSD